MSARVVPVKTHILTDKDDIVDVIMQYASPLLKPGDIITIAETVVALTQGRFVRPDALEPGPAALLLSRFFNQMGSLSSPYAMEAVMREHGAWRVTGAFILGSLSRFLCLRSGDFYRLAGAQASLVDDVTGNMPPFDKYIVFGPKEPAKVVQRIKDKTGYEAAIMDANDLGRVKIVAATPKANRKFLEKIFKANPAGNADEQTPIILVNPKR